MQIRNILFLFIIFVFGAILPLKVYAQSNMKKSENIIEIAQNKPTNLFDLLFNNNQQTKKKTPKRKVQTRTTKRKKTATPSLSPITSSIEKSKDATRLMVFGDSLAIDLSKALTRFYAEDPNLVVIGRGVGSSGFVRSDFFDWNKALKDAIIQNDFDIAVVIIGINDKQNLSVRGKSEKPLTDRWKREYTKKLNGFLEQFRTANKPVVWVGLPPMASSKFSAAMIQIASLQRLAAFSFGAQYIDIYDRFTDVNGRYISMGPDINGKNVLMRKSDGIHFSRAGSDKVATYINQSLKLFYRGGVVSLAISDPLLRTDALLLLRPPFQGLGQIRMLSIAGSIVPLNALIPRSTELIKVTNLVNNTTNNIIQKTPNSQNIIKDKLEKTINAPSGRADDFGVGITMVQDADE